MAEQTDPSQPQPAPEPAEGQRSSVDTLAEAQALAALDELIAKVDSGSELSGSNGAPPRADRGQEPPPEAYALTGDVPPYDGWYVAMKDDAQGPFTVEHLKERWSRGEIGADTLCWREGMGEWRPLSRLHGLTAAISPRPRPSGLKALSAKPPQVRSQPSDFVPSTPSLLKSLAAQEVRTERQIAAVPVAAEKAERAGRVEKAEKRPPTAPTTPEGPRRVPPPQPEARPQVFSADRRDRDLDEDEDLPRRPAGVSGAKLFFSLFAASVLGGVVGGYVVKVTMPPPPSPEPVVIHEPAPTAPPPAPTAPAPAKAEAPKAMPPKAEPPKAEPPAPPKAVEAKPKPAPKPEGEDEAAAKSPPADKADKKKPAPPKSQLDKDFQDAFGQ